MSPRRRLLSAITIGAVLVGVLALSHHAIAKFAIARAVSAATGYEVRFGDMSLGWSHATLMDIHVRKGGDPVLDADRVDIDYALRDVFPGGKHRFGFAGIAVDRPTFTLVRHPDGTYNLGGGGTSSSPPKSTQAAAAPLLFSARVRDGTIVLVDQAPMEKDLATQSVVNVAIDASVQSNARTVAKVDGALVGRRSQSAAIERWPLSVRSVIDYQRGFAMHRFRAAELPLRGMLNFLVHAKIARFDDGVMRRRRRARVRAQHRCGDAVRVSSRRRRPARRRADRARTAGQARARFARHDRSVRRRRHDARFARHGRRRSAAHSRRHV